MKNVKTNLTNLMTTNQVNASPLNSWGGLYNFTPSGKSIQNKGISPDIWIQPLRKKLENRNIFGDQRYRNESFLRHRLDVVGENNRDKSIIQKKAYYLTDEHISDNPESRRPANDQELNIGLTIIEKVVKVYGQKIPQSASRSSHWLALAGPEITKKLNDLDNETDNGYKTNYK